jgi:energy-coupling factor transport system substrate-specific component
MIRESDTPGGWRTVDIVVTAALAVAFGVVFLAWNAFYLATTPLFAFFWPAQAVLYAIWLLPGVLAGLVVRRPGAAFFAGLASAAVSVLLGSPYGLDALISGALQGAGAELGFAIGRYRTWSLPIAALAGGLAGAFAAVHDVLLYYPAFALPLQIAFGLILVASGVVGAGLGGWLLSRALARTGVLAAFPSGRSQRVV